MTTPLNISSDDAAFFLSSSSSNDLDPMASQGQGDMSDDEDTEDPVGRGASKVGQLDMFVSKPVIHKPFRHGSRAVPTTELVLTPGANGIRWR